MRDLQWDVTRARPDPPRVAWRRRMREEVLRQAWELVCREGWDGVRIADLAERAEVSRPSIYKEFGSRAGVGEALVRWETERFLAGVAGALAAAEDEGTRAALEAGVRHALTEAERSPFLHAVVAAARGGSDALLPFLTARPDPVYRSAHDLVRAWLEIRLPAHETVLLEEAADLTVRLTLSHIALPAGYPGESARRVARAVWTLLGCGA